MNFELSNKRQPFAGLTKKYPKIKVYTKRCKMCSTLIKNQVTYCKACSSEVSEERIKAYQLRKRKKKL
jgi:recombinational DNA repair protein RecR